MSWRDWPVYSESCRDDMRVLLAKGGTLSAYKANFRFSVGPAEGSWAWKAERLLEKIHDVKHAIVCSSGTTALVTLLRSLYRFGGRIATPALTFSATTTAFLYAGCIPAFADVSLPDCTLDPNSVAQLFGPRAQKRAFPVDLFGRQAPVFGDGAADSCQAIGLPPIAKHGVWSFNGRKQVPAGEGGAIYTQDDRVAEACRLDLNHAENFGAIEASLNGRMNEQTALLVWHGLTELARRQRNRTRYAGLLNEMLQNIPGILTPNLDSHALYVYPLIVRKGMPQLAERLRTAGVECQEGYIQPTLDEYPAFRGLEKTSLLVTHSLSTDRLLLFPQVTPTAYVDEINDLGEKLVKALSC